MRIYVATHNAHKLREIGEIFPVCEIVADDPEGVEENEQLEILQSIDCDYIQGFIWGRPPDSKDVENMI